MEITKDYEKILQDQQTILENNEYPKPNSTWRHYKGGLYKVEFLSMREEDQEILVNYRNVAHPLPILWSRPYSQWSSQVGETKRFVLVSQ